MPSRLKIVALLRIVSAIIIFMGVCAMIGSFVTAQNLHAFSIPIPAWLIGAAVAFTGVRYWFRLGDLQKKLIASAGS